MAPRPSYKTFVVERPVARPRRHVWDIYVAFLESAAPGVAEGETAFQLGEWHLVERTLSFEPPWRRVYEVTGAPLRLYQATTTLRDDGDTCLLVWSYLAEALDGDDAARSDEFLARVQRALTRAADEVVTRAQA